MFASHFTFLTVTVTRHHYAQCHVQALIIRIACAVDAGASSQNAYTARALRLCYPAPISRRN